MDSSRKINSMSSLLYHVASGHVFFTGIALFTLAAIVSVRPGWLYSRLSVLMLLIGTIAVAISSTPTPTWLLIAAGFASLVWLASLNYTENRKWESMLFAGVWLVCLAVELPYHFMPTIVRSETATLLVIADSVTAGTGSSDKTFKWPAQIKRDHSIAVDDRSVPGAKTSTALRKAQGEPITSSVVFVEIGGNDMFGSTGNAKFRQDLDALLSQLCKRERQVIMFELPLPPFRNQYGAIQRTLARKYDVRLIPKRIFLSVLLRRGSTIDSVHLTQLGHDRMAKTVWNFIHSAFDPTIP